MKKNASFILTLQKLGKHYCSKKMNPTSYFDYASRDYYSKRRKGHTRQINPQKISLTTIPAMR